MLRHNVWVKGPLMSGILVTWLSHTAYAGTPCPATLTVSPLLDPKTGEIAIDFYRDETSGDVWGSLPAWLLPTPAATLPKNIGDYGLLSLYLAKYACWDKGVRDWMPTNIVNGIYYCTNPEDKAATIGYMQAVVDKMEAELATATTREKNKLPVLPKQPKATEAALDFCRDPTTGDVWGDVAAWQLTPPVNLPLPSDLGSYGLRSIYLAKYACWDTGTRDWMPTNLVNGIYYCTNPEDRQVTIDYMRTLINRMETEPTPELFALPQPVTPATLANYPEARLLTPLKESVIEDSEDEPKDNPYPNRIYYYDMAIDNTGRAHVIYALPQPDRIHTRIIYAVENGDTWNKQILSTEGKYIPEGIQIALDASGTFHVVYIKGTDDFDSGLFYRTIDANGVPAPEQKVDIGGWRSRLEINPVDNMPYIVREAPEGLRLHRLDAAGQFQSTVIQLSQVPANESPGAPLRLGEFHIDTFGGFHIVFGDRFEKMKNPKKNVEDFRHHLWYAYANSAAAPVWNNEIIDNSGAIWELEFWIDLTTSPNGSPIVATYNYNVAEMSTHKTFGTFYYRDGSGWHRTISTRNQPPTPTRPDGGREGMGPGLVVNEYGYHGVWDNSPEQPFDFFTGDDHGGTFYRYSPDGTNWSVHQLIAPYSAEGRCETQLYGDQLNVLFLGDHKDTKLRLLRLAMPPRNLMQIYPYQVVHYQGEAVTLRSFYRGDFVGDWYTFAVECLRNSVNDQSCSKGQGDIWTLTENQTWKLVKSLAEVTPFYRNTQGLSLNQEFQTVLPSTAPFNKQTEYDIYSVVTFPGQPLTTSQQTLTPLFREHIYANWPSPAQARQIGRSR